MTAREEILATIRAALQVQASDPAASHARVALSYDRHGKRDNHARLELFLDRLLDYDTVVLQIDAPAEIPAAIAEALRRANDTSLLAAPGFPSAWLPAATSITLDDNLPNAILDRAPAVVTTCEAAVASTGTILLVHGGAQGRRVITLLPDHHICLVHRDQVFELLPEALAAIAGSATRPITTISGPSATSDIEMTRIRGVHGPRRLTVLIY